MKKEPTDLQQQIESSKLQHSMVCNEQLFYQELRIAAEEAEKEDNEEFDK